jgi:hypothetical protein
MTCLICKDLERTLDYKSSKYFGACSAAYIKSERSLRPKKMWIWSRPRATWKSTG